MTSIWFPNNKYPPNTKNYLPCFVLGGARGGLVLGGRDYLVRESKRYYLVGAHHVAQAAPAVKHLGALIVQP